MKELSISLEVGFQVPVEPLTINGSILAIINHLLKIGKAPERYVCNGKENRRTVSVGTDAFFVDPNIWNGLGAVTALQSPADSSFHNPMQLIQADAKHPGYLRLFFESQQQIDDYPFKMKAKPAVIARPGYMDSHNPMLLALYPRYFAYQIGDYLVGVQMSLTAPSPVVINRAHPATYTG